MSDCFKWNFCVAMTALALPWCGVANEQTPPPEPSLESIEIRGIRGSLIQSLNTKRHSEGIVDAITAEEIGKFPDKNVAESLQRITGVSLTRVQGEGERIGVRGTAPSQNRTTFNGQNIASADWWISSQPNRGFNYTLLSAEMVSSLEVHKSPQADHDEGSLGGSVSINTRRPLSTQDQMLVGTIQFQHNDVSNQNDPQLTLMYNWINASKDFAALVSLVRHQRRLRRDGLESWGWTMRNFNQDEQGRLTETKLDNADHQGIWSAGGGGSAIFEQQRILSSAMVSLQYQPHNDWNIELNSLYSQLAADNSNHNFLWQPNSVYGRGGHISEFDIQDNTLVYARFEPVDENNGQAPFNTAVESIWRESNIETEIVQLSVEHDFDYWQTQYQLGYTRAKGGTHRDLTSKWAANSGYSVDLRQSQNIIAQYDVSPLAADAWQISQVRWDNQTSSDEELFAQADFELQLDRPFIQSLKFGGKFKGHQRDFLRIRSTNGDYDGLAGELDWTLADYSGSFPAQYLQGVGSAQTLKAYTFADVIKLDVAYQSLPFEYSEEQSSRFDISEDSYALYSKINFARDGLHGNFGIRVVHTKQQAAAFVQLADDHLWSSRDKSYTDILPSLNLTLDWSKALLFRLSASKVMSRPEYHHLMPSTNYNLTQAQGAGGNPELDPFRASKFDVGFEWYFDEASLLSMAAFHQSVNSFIDIHRHKEVYENTEMVISRPVNGAGGRIYGVELSWQQELIYGFGVIANYTYVQGERKDSDTGKDIDIPGNSDHTINLTSYYENDWFGLRLSYNYRTEFATGAGEEITDDFGQWDINVTVNLSDNIALLMEGINLSDEILYSYERNEFAPVGIYRNGRRLYAGIRFEF